MLKKKMEAKPEVRYLPVTLGGLDKRSTSLRSTWATYWALISKNTKTNKNKVVVANREYVNMGFCLKSDKNQVISTKKYNMRKFSLEVKKKKINKETMQ